jgi:hypothetical protein
MVGQGKGNVICFNKEAIEAVLEAIRELARARGRVKEGAADPAWPGGRCFSVRSA